MQHLIGTHGNSRPHPPKSNSCVSPDHGRTPEMMQAIGAEGFFATPSHGAAIIAIGQTIETAIVQILRAWEVER